jgi:hypothetical protein
MKKILGFCMTVCMIFTLTIPALAAEAVSTTDNLDSYTGNIGVAWVRDTSPGRSPITFSEAFSGVYTLEVDFLAYHQAAAILAASKSFKSFTALSDAAGSGASSVICSSLGIGDISVPSETVRSVVALGWPCLSSIDRDKMYNTFVYMAHSDLMKVHCMMAGGMAIKGYSIYSTTTKLNPDTQTYTYSNIANPSAGKYGFWRTDEFGCLFTL